MASGRVTTLDSVKRTAPILSAALLVLLASCAPTMTGPRVGRIVNGTTGAEGSVSFTRGTLRPRLGDPFAADNAVIQIGGQTYTGRTVVLDGRPGATLPYGLEFSVGFGGGTNVGTNGFFGWDTHAQTPRTHQPVTRSGNLIARTASARPSTLTCTLLIDADEHGIGDCTGSDGARYTLQF